jgi:hypothetical protein
LFEITYPDGYIWEFPGVYSISVPYGKENNFFFAGHISILMICVLELYTSKNYKLSIFALITMILQVCLIIFLRGYYSIDVFSAIPFGHYLWTMGDIFSKYIDYRILGIPFHKRYPH